MRSETGSVFPILAVVLVGGILAALIAVELGRLVSERRAISFAADMAAEAGAAMLDEAAVRGGQLSLNPSAARERAVSYAISTAPSGSDIFITSNETEVCVEIASAFEPRLLAMVGARPVELRAAACASPAFRARR